MSKKLLAISTVASMVAFMGTKSVLATPMTRAEYCDYRGWQLPENEDGCEPVYLVEYTDGGKPNDDRHAGYITMSPKEVFDNAYRQNGSLTFGDAITVLKKGQRVARSGWNGKGMWLFLIQGSNDIAKLHGYGFGEYEGEPTFVDAVFMKTVDNKLAPWLASQTDVLAEDWLILE